MATISSSCPKHKGNARQHLFPSTGWLSVSSVDQPQPSRKKTWPSSDHQLCLLLPKASLLSFFLGLPLFLFNLTTLPVFYRSWNRRLAGNSRGYGEFKGYGRRVIVLCTLTIGLSVSFAHNFDVTGVHPGNHPSQKPQPLLSSFRFNWFYFL
jgi:hypothetical protein